MNFRCMSTLKRIPREGFSAAALRHLAGGARKLPFRLPYSRADIVSEQFRQAEHMSISGVQDKISLKLEKGELVPTESNGEYILKPIPSAAIPAFREDIPANEHLTMQLASQVFGISAAVNALVFLEDGEPAYLTRRFDRIGDRKILQEDFCQLGGRTEQSHGKNYKYDCTYEELGRLLRNFCPAYQVEVEKLFRRILFNYVFSNGDAHLKNFSLHSTEHGDHILTPAYDLLCTSLHFPDESRTALEMFDDFETSFFRENGFYGTEDFMKLAEKYGIKAERAGRFLADHRRKRNNVESMIEASFLSEVAKKKYLWLFRDRMLALK